MPRHYTPRPARPAFLTARCGHEVAVKKTGKLPEWCESCREARSVAARLRIVVAQVDMAALPVTDAKATGDVLIAIGQRGTKRWRAEKKRRGGVG